MEKKVGVYAVILVKYKHINFNTTLNAIRWLLFYFLSYAISCCCMRFCIYLSVYLSTYTYKRTPLNLHQVIHWIRKSSLYIWCKWEILNVHMCVCLMKLCTIPFSTGTIKHCSFVCVGEKIKSILLWLDWTLSRVNEASHFNGRQIIVNT